MKITVIVPVYNAINMLPRMLDSLLAQSFRDFEVLLIDDGSTDGCAILCDEYAAKDNRIRVFHKQNEGVAMARQMGIENARGEYSIHADADDWVEPNMLEELYSKAKQENADVVIADYFVDNDNNAKMMPQQPTSLKPEFVLRDMLNNRIFGALWHKLIRHSLYDKYQVRFFLGINHCEDLLAWVQLLQHPELRIAYLPKAYYHYCINSNSITRHFTRDTYEMRLRFLEKFDSLLFIPERKELVEKVAFNIFTEGVIYNVLTKDEIRIGLKQYKNQVKHLESLKWRLGFMMLSYGMSGIARKLIHY